jgi:hypothetical protein
LSSRSADRSAVKGGGRKRVGGAECGLTQNINTALAVFRKLDDRFGDHFVGEVGSWCRPNSRTNNFKCDGH